MAEDEFVSEFTRVLARIGAVVVVLVLIYYLLSSVFKLERGEVVGIIKDAIMTAVSRVV
jgi:hypothetical protein